MVGSQHKWLGHGISGCVTALVKRQAAGSLHKWLGHCISGWVTASAVGSLHKARARCAQRRLRASGSLANQVQNTRKNRKRFSVSEKNRPPGDPLGGPKSLLEAKKSLAELKIEGSKAFLVPHARN